MPYRRVRSQDIELWERCVAWFITSRRSPNAGATGGIACLGSPRMCRPTVGIPCGDDTRELRRHLNDNNKTYIRRQGGLHTDHKDNIRHSYYLGLEPSISYSLMIHQFRLYSTNSRLTFVVRSLQAPQQPFAQLAPAGREWSFHRARRIRNLPCRHLVKERG